MAVITKNKNSESLFRWALRKSDPLDSICFLFISVSNANNARYAPLFQHTQSTRIVYLKGLNIKFSDRFFLIIFKSIPILFRRKIQKYKILHILSLLNWPTTETQVLHIDDPLYTKSETKKLLQWEQTLISKSSVPIVVCTNAYSDNWYKSILKNTKVMIIEQGFSKSNGNHSKVGLNSFTCVYSSPYIHYLGDKHGLHSTWGAKLLIEEVIPKLNSIDSSIKIVLIGELGKNARIALSEYTNWVSLGRVDQIQNQTLLSQCDIGLYPRLRDHKRSILKIMSYLGAGLPVVTFDLIDSKIVSDYSLGPVVTTIDDFILSIVNLKNFPDLYNYYRKNINQIIQNYTWENLSKKMEVEIFLLRSNSR